MKKNHWSGADFTATLDVFIVHVHTLRNEGPLLSIEDSRGTLSYVIRAKFRSRAMPVLNLTNLEF